MAKFLKRSQRVVHVEYALYFERDNGLGGGWGPSCDKDGNVSQEELAAKPIARQEWERVQDCIARGVPTGYLEPIIHEYRNRYVEPAVIECDTCQRPVTLHSAIENECACGAIYNMSGQALAPRECWGEETGETYADIVGPCDLD
jgi:hypothetical protein